MQRGTVTFHSMCAFSIPFNMTCILHPRSTQQKTAAHHQYLPYVDVHGDVAYLSGANLHLVHDRLLEGGWIDVDLNLELEFLSRDINFMALARLK